MPAAHKKRKRVLLISLAILLALMVGGFGAFFAYTADYSAAGLETQSLYIDTKLRIESNNHYTSVQLWDDTPDTGFIFYPGGKVASDAYLLYLADVARAGYFCAVVEVPFHLAIFGVGRADTVIDDHPEIDTWFVGGHSLGGVAAASYAEKNEELRGLVLLASYPTADLSASAIGVLSVTASGDGVLKWDSYGEAKAKLPAGTIYTEIEGGNHGGFGDYGAQDGDGAATIPPEEQRAKTAAATIVFLNAAA